MLVMLSYHVLHLHCSVQPVLKQGKIFQENYAFILENLVIEMNSGEI